tara:strand:- start:149 stop:433 length:285 start_codon:yes stop_codon:yes gene_type:complete
MNLFTVIFLSGTPLPPTSTNISTLITYIIKKIKKMHIMNIINNSPEEAIKTALFYKDEYGRLRKKTNDYSGLKAAFGNELIVDSRNGIIRQHKH